MAKPGETGGCRMQTPQQINNSFSTAFVSEKVLHWNRQSSWLVGCCPLTSSVSLRVRHISPLRKRQRRVVYFTHGLLIYSILAGASNNTLCCGGTSSKASWYARSKGTGT